MCPETIRSRTLECMLFAQHTGDPHHQALLLDLAHSWANLANALDRYQLFAEAAEAKLIYGRKSEERPHSPRVAQRVRKKLNRLTRSPSLYRRRKKIQLRPAIAAMSGGSQKRYLKCRV
jgi:hypothetical protein